MSSNISHLWFLTFGLTTDVDILSREGGMGVVLCLYLDIVGFIPLTYETNQDND